MALNLVGDEPGLYHNMAVLFQVILPLQHDRPSFVMFCPQMFDMMFRVSLLYKCKIVRDRHTTRCRVRVGSARAGVASTAVWVRSRSAHRKS